MARKPNNKGAAAPATKPTSPANAAPQQEKAKRPPAVVQNGVQRPRPGGLCAAVWEITEAMTSRDHTGNPVMPTIAEVKAKAAEQGLNMTNVSIEYYRCRQFHGVRGRQPKPQPQAETAQ